MGIFERFRGKNKEVVENEPNPIDLQTKHVCELLALTSTDISEVIERDFMGNGATLEEKYENLSDKGYDPENLLRDGKEKADELQAVSDNYVPDRDGRGGIRGIKYLRLSRIYAELTKKNMSPEDLHLKLELADKISKQGYQIIRASLADLKPYEAQALANDDRFLEFDENKGKEPVEQFIKGINNNTDPIVERVRNFIRNIANTNRQKQYQAVANILNKESKITSSET